MYSVNLIVFLTSIVFFFNFIFREKIGKFLGIIDYPDKVRKLHKKPVPLNGGIWFIFYLILSILLSLFFNYNYNEIFNSILFISLLIFFVGFLDDQKNLNANLRLLLFFFIFFIFSELHSDLRIEKIKFASLDIVISLNIYSSMFTAFCLTAFINSINLIDGINALSNTFLLIIIATVWLIFREEDIFFIILIFFLTINSIIIYQGKYFLGDSGSLSISAFVGLYIVYQYNLNLSSPKQIFLSEDIFLLMALPGLDMMRVFFNRIINKRNPFKSERNHIHHLLIKKISLKKTLFFLILLVVFPLILNFYFHLYVAYLIIFTIISYVVLLKFAVE